MHRRIIYGKYELTVRLGVYLPMDECVHMILLDYLRLSGLQLVRLNVIFLRLNRKPHR